MVQIFSRFCFVLLPLVLVMAAPRAFAWNPNDCPHEVVTEKAVAPTCTTAGHTEKKYCSVCGKVFVSAKEFPSFGGHKPVKVKATRATCTTAGKGDQVVCRRCGEVLETLSEGEAALGHDFYPDQMLTKKAATCEAAGIRMRRCRRCKKAVSEQIPALGHAELVNATLVEPTCTDPGSKKGTCPRCNKAVEEVLDPLGHDPYESKPAVEATPQTDASSAEISCHRCGEVIVPAVVVKSHTRYAVVDLSGGASAETYPVSFMDEVPFGGWTDEYKSSKLVLHWVPEGSFTMGSPVTESGRYEDEDLHVVTLSKGFWMGVFEVTQKQWDLVQGGSQHTGYGYARYGEGDMYPLFYVSYADIRGSVDGTNWPAKVSVDADSFMGKLRARTGGATSFDLPTEAQWEYACRAGSLTLFSYGDTADGDYMWYNRNTAKNLGGEEMLNLVGQKKPNAWGFYDMHGNVWEWCLDRKGVSLGFDPETDPKGKTIGSTRVIRGGCFTSDPKSCRSATRNNYDPVDFKSPGIGFRIMCGDDL